MAMRMRLMALSAMVLVSACGHVTNAAQGADYRLYEAAARPDSPIVAIIDIKSRAAHDQLPLGTPSPDWKHYYTVRGGSLFDTDPATGATSIRVGLPADYRLPPATSTGIPGGLSQDGRWLVLQRFDGAVSHFLVFDTTSLVLRRSIDLAGYFQFDAVSNDGDRLFLIQYVNTTDYHVRSYSVSGGALDPNFIVDKNDGAAAMNGLKLTGIASRDGTWLFSVYARGHAGAFIHALYLGGGFAFCLDLPGNGFDDGDQSSLDWSLSLSPDGTHLYATNPALGVVTEILAGGPSVGRTVHIAEPSHVWPAGSVVSADSKTLVIAGATGVVWLDTATLTQRHHALDSWTVRSLALSPDGATLYVVNDAGAIAEVSMANGSVSTTFDPNIAHPIALMRVEGVA